MLGRTGDGEWLIYGGHRLWIAPEHDPSTFHPDNSPVTAEDHGNFVRVAMRVVLSTGIAKEMDISLDRATHCVQIVHRLRNQTSWNLELARWGVSAMASGGGPFPRCRRA